MPSREYRLANPEKVRDSARRYYEENRDKIRERQRNWRRQRAEYMVGYYAKNKEKWAEYQIRHKEVLREKVAAALISGVGEGLDIIARRMLRQAKSRAKTKGLEFSITTADFEVPSTCPILGMQMMVSRGRFAWSSPSLDRINPSLGYVPGNVRVISHRANWLLNNGTLDEFEKIVADRRRTEMSKDER